MATELRWHPASRLTSTRSKSPVQIPLHVLQLVLWALVSPVTILAAVWRRRRAVNLHAPSFHFAATSSLFATRSSAPDVSGDVQMTTMRDFIMSKCPTLGRGFRPSSLLFNGHLQTVYGVYGDFSKIDHVTYDRKLLRLKDGGTISLDFTSANDKRPFDDETPIIVVLHGMTGGSHERYVRSVLAPACAPVEEGGLGYRGVVINFRGCAGTPITSEQFYHPGVTDDTRQALMYISSRYPQARLLGMGFSLGANVLVRYLAQEGEHSRLAAGLVVGCPWDLQTVSAKLTNGHFMDRIYSRALAANLKSLVTRHADALCANTSFAQVCSTITSLKAPSLWEFDTQYTIQYASYAAPFPFSDVRKYYTWASSHNVLAAVRVPLLAINADDDPIVPILPRDVGGNGLVALAVTRGGGHLGWFEAGRRQWFKKPALEWLKAVGEDLVVDNLRGKPLREVDGFIVEDGRDDIGCREVAGGGKHSGLVGPAQGPYSGL
ncbi:AB-hydrolase YheT [Amylocystis lapponica]|nr:AB-hydrolase YheT [Amylocystis lapponica]